MDLDYRKLCVDLFGTDDVNRLTEIAQRLRERNARGAGRKKRFTPEEVENIRVLVENGMTINEAARRFHTSRQVIGKYLNERPADGCTLRITYMYQQHPCTIIDVDFLNQRVSVQNRTEDVLHRAFGVLEKPTWSDFEAFLQTRCFPATRGNARELLNDLHLTAYDPLQIVEKTRGRTAEDDMWMKFSYYPMKGEGYGHNQS